MTAVNVTQLTAALSTAETDVEPPSRERTGSFTSHLATLEVGDCAARPRRLPGTMTIGDYAENGSRLRENLRDSTNRCVRDAAKKTNGIYNIEVCDVTTPGRNVYMLAIVTRVG